MIDIKDISGKILFSVQENDETVFVEELMSSDYIRLSWHSDKGDSIPVSSYIEYDGEKYRLLETYTPQMENEAEYVYSPKFDSRVIAWGKQIVPVYTYGTDGTTVKTREMDWEFTGSPADAMFMVKQAIKNETGEEWTVQLSDSLPATISISSQSASILSVLNSIADECETEWWTDKNTNTLYLSKCVKGDPITLEVGKQVGVPSVTDNSEGYYTRFYAFGSTRNIVQESLEGGASVNKRLTLDPVKYPYGYKDIRPGLTQEEVFVKTLYYDDIYPSSTLTISDVRARLRYRVDNEGNRIKIGGTDEEPVYEQYAIWYFRIAGFAFNPDTIIEDKILSVSFESGQLAGRDFELEYHEKAETVKDGNDVTPFEINAGDYEIIIDESTGSIIPGLSYIIPQEGDSVILFNIVMPEEYTKSAQDELEEKLDKYLVRQEEDNRIYRISSNPVYFYENKTDLRLGQSVTFVYGGMSVSTRIQSVEKRLDLPCYQDIGLGNKVLKGVIQKLKDDVAYTNQQIDIIKAFNELSVSLTNAYANAQREMIEGFAAIKKLWSLKEDDEGNQYAYTKLPIVGAAGLTLFAGEQLKVDSIFKGLPLDTTTLQWVDGVLTVVGGTGGGEAGFVKWQNIEGKPSWITTEKPKYSYTEITGLTEELARYVTLSTDQSITGMKDFADGMKVSGTLFKVINGVLTLDCSIAVTGGITAYALGEQTAATIMDGVAVDGITITKEDGVLKVVGGGGASNWDELEGKPSWITDIKPVYAWGEITQKPTTLSGYGIQASDVLNVLKTVDGSGSGLDADTLDGKHYIDIINGNVASATKLQTARTIWGQSFDGTNNVSGRFELDGNYRGILALYDGTTYRAIQSYGSKPLTLNPEGNNVAIGAIEPDEKLHVSGNVCFSGYARSYHNEDSWILYNARTDNTNKIGIWTDGFNGYLRKGEVNALYWDSYRIISFIDVVCNKNLQVNHSTKTGDLYINGIRLHKSQDGVIKLEGNLAVTGGITQYAINTVDIPTIMDGVVADEVTLTKSNGVLKIKNAGSGSSFDKTAMWSALAGATNEQINETHLTTALNDYLLKSQYTAQDVLNKIKTVDGSGSELDADLLDDWHRNDLPRTYNDSKTYGCQFATGGTNTSWKKIFALSVPTTGPYKGCTVKGTIYYTFGNHAQQYDTTVPFEVIFTLDGESHTGHFVKLYLPKYFLYDVIRVVKVSDYSYEIQVRQYSSYNSGYIYYQFWAYSSTGTGYNSLQTASNGTVICSISNVAEMQEDTVYNAIKLKTARTIWGQNFDGTSNISGRFELDGNYRGILALYDGTTYRAIQSYGSKPLTLNPEGNNVAIGAIEPDEKLHVSGNVCFSGYIRSYHNEDSWILYNARTDNTNKIGIWTDGFNGYLRKGEVNALYWTDTHTNIYVNTFINANVSIGTFGSTERLTVNGNIKMTGYLYSSHDEDSWLLYTTRSDGTQKYGIWTDGFSLYFRKDESNCMIINSQYTRSFNDMYFNGRIIVSGNAGIGTSSPSQKLHVVGNILATGGGTFYSSDIRAKTIIERPKLSLNSIANAPVIKFRWNGYNGLKDDNKLHVGGIAQYIEKILPECVIGQKDDFLSFDYATTGYIFSVLTARHLLSYETRTDRIIRKLKERIKRLEKQLNIENHEKVCIVAD